MVSVPAESNRTTAETLLEVEDLAIHYGGKPALTGASFEVRRNEIFGIIGPANSGKTSYLRAVNRMDLFTSGMQVSGSIRFNGQDVRRWRNVYALRRRIGVVFPLPVGLPLSIYDNVALAPRLSGVRKKIRLDETKKARRREAKMQARQKGVADESQS